VVAVFTTQGGLPMVQVARVVMPSQQSQLPEALKPLPLLLAKAVKPST
jgi:hypothetical protein